MQWERHLNCHQVAFKDLKKSVAFVIIIMMCNKVLHFNRFFLLIPWRLYVYAYKSQCVCDRLIINQYSPQIKVTILYLNYE